MYTQHSTVSLYQSSFWRKGPLLASRGTKEQDCILPNTRIHRCNHRQHKLKPERFILQGMTGRFGLTQSVIKGGGFLKASRYWRTGKFRDSKFSRFSTSGSSLARKELDGVWLAYIRKSGNNSHAGNFHKIHMIHAKYPAREYYLFYSSY